MIPNDGFMEQNKIDK